ncbi:MAG: NusG domain II-containing protein [Bacillota bacterium]
MKITDILTLYDKILIVFVISLSIILFLFPFYNFDFNSNNNNLILKVQLENELIKTIDLAASYEQPIHFQVQGPIGIHKIEVDQGRVRVEEAPKDDPLKICEQTGWIERAGPIIVCVPNKLSIWLENDDSEIDGMSW